MVPPVDAGRFNLLVGWISMFGGVVAGAIIGLFFHSDTWLGGYSAFRRRLVRLGHIACFGMGLINVLFGLSLIVVPLPSSWRIVASSGFLLAAVAMPVTCFLAAWRPALRRLFPIPVTAALVALGALLGGWFLS